MRLRKLLALGVLVAATTGPSTGVALEVTGPAATSPGRTTLPAPEPCRGCWRPQLRVSWQWQLRRTPRVADLLPVQMYDVDGFEATRALVRAMHARGIKVVCYLSAGAWERWRPDAHRFPAEVLGESNGWPGERWLDIRRRAIMGPIIGARIAMCARKGFDAVEFDNVDGYRNATGFPLEGADQLRYNVFLANAAHRRGLSVLLKNDLDQVRTLLPYFDGALNEQCHRYEECGRLTRFVDAGKPVFGVEYTLRPSGFCGRANARDLNFLVKRPALGPWRHPCRGR
jgi:hypothetical protein